MKMIRQGIAIADRVTKICQMTKFPLDNFISASPSESAKTVKVIVMTASGTLSVRTKNTLPDSADYLIKSVATIFDINFSLLDRVDQELA